MYFCKQNGSKILVSMKRVLFILTLLFSFNLLYAQSGICGDKLKWKLKGNKIVITGSGKMTSPYPSWAPYASKVNEIVLPSRLTSICNNAFRDFYNLEKIELPKNLKLIGEKAFYGCEDLTEIILPMSIERIESEAFAFCGITFLYLPPCKERKEVKEGVPNKITIPYLSGNGVFKNCRYLESVVFPDNFNGLAFIPDSTFYNCSNLNVVKFSIGCSIGNHAFENCGYLGDLIIPFGCSFVGKRAFANSHIRSIQLPKSVNLIDDEAFMDCEQLSHVIIEDGTYYGPTNTNDDERSITIGENAFKNCKKLKVLSLPSKIKAVSLGKGAFGGCENILALNLSCVSGKIPKNLCNGCMSLDSILLSKSVTEIADSAFLNCEKLNNITLPDSLIKIGCRAFANCQSITNISIPQRVKSIGFAAFANCISLESVSYPDSLDWICCYVFSGDNQLRYFYGNSSTDDKRCVIVNNELIWFAPQGIVSYQIPDYVNKIHYSCFSGCSALRRIKLPHEGVYIDDNAFSGSGIEEIIIPPFSTIRGCAFMNCGFLKNVVIEEGVRTVSRSSFYNCNRLQRLVLPASITYIPQYFVRYCPELSYVYIQNTKDNVTIEAEAFPKSTKLLFKSYLDDSNEKRYPPMLSIVQGSLLIRGPLDNDIGANSSYTLVAKVNNSGERTAQMCKTSISLWGENSGIEIYDSYLYDIKPNETKEISIPFHTSSDTRNGKVGFSLQICEQFGYNSETAQITAPIYAHGKAELSSEGMKHRAAAKELVDIAKNTDDLFPAIAEYKLVIDSDPSYSDAYYNLAKLYTMLGKEKSKNYYDDAKTYYVQYKRLVPEEIAEIDAEIYALEVLKKK